MQMACFNFSRSPAQQDFLYSGSRSKNNHITCLGACVTQFRQQQDIYQLFKVCFTYTSELLFVLYFNCNICICHTETKNYLLTYLGCCQRGAFKIFNLRKYSAGIKKAAPQVIIINNYVHISQRSSYFHVYEGLKTK